MATTYGYGGEFSSDEEIDKFDQKAERAVRNFDDYDSRPSPEQIEKAIETIKEAAVGYDVNLSDEIIASLLDHYRIQRGPIVDSTRQLYKKIVLRMVRGEQGQDNNNDSNGTNVPAANNFNNNNNPISKKPIQVADSFSSDEDEPLVSMPTSIISKKPGVQFSVNNNNDIEMDSMEVDSETPTGPVRETKPIDISSSDDESDDDDEKHSDEDEQANDNNSDVPDVTPIKHPNQAMSATSGARSAIKATPRQLSAKRQQPIAQSTPKDAVGSVKKPYTRSQRLAAARAAQDHSADQSTDVQRTAASAFITSSTSRASRGRYILLATGLVVLVLAGLLYRFGPDLMKSTPALSRKISF